MTTRPRRTYWHLEGQAHKPTDYEIGTSRLLYHPERGFEVNAPGADWYDRFTRASPLTAPDWEQFSDPLETTYARYVERQAKAEAFLEHLAGAADRAGEDAKLSPAWLQWLEGMIGPLRFPLHGLQMAAAYVGHMAPSGRVVTICAMQAADEMRRTQWLAFRIGQLRKLRPTYAAGGKDIWQHDANWQPLRRVVEQLLVTYDWGESFSALCLCVKPLFDRLVFSHLGESARSAGDQLMAHVCASLDEDCRWHRDWATALVRVAVGQRRENREVLRRWVADWRGRVGDALHALAPVFDGAPGGSSFAATWTALQREFEDDLHALTSEGA